jgi:predicted TIM-barrel fold metal-dependent hydrolase
MIDMHAHWRPAGLLQSLRQRSSIPQIVHNDQGVEVFRTRFGDESLADAFDNAKDYLARMDAHDVSVSVLSLLSSFCWIQGEAVEQSSALCRTYNESMSQLCLEHPGRFACFATVPMRDLKVGAKELEAALKLPGMVGVQVPGNAFMSLASAEAMRPILEVLNRHKAILFVHYGPMPGDPFPRIAKGSGTQVSDVNKLVKQFSEMQKMMKRMGGMAGKGGKKGGPMAGIPADLAAALGSRPGSR